MRLPGRPFGLWALSLLLVGTAAASLVHLTARMQAPASTPVVLGGEADFAPATPDALDPGDGTPRARIAFVGDIMHHPEQAGDDFARTYEAIGPILRQYDLVVGNLEFPVAPQPSVAPASRDGRFSGSPEHVRALARAGIDLVSTSNNHSFDMGYEGALSTLDILRAEGIESFGTGAHGAEPGPRLVEVGGLRIAFVGYTFPPNVYPDDAGRPAPWPEHWPIHELYFGDWTGPYREEGLALFGDHVRASRSAGADFIVAVVHWGQEWRYAPNRHQRLAARDMIDAGFDLVVGSHPHVLNPAEFVDGSLVAYSLGNFVSAFRELEVRTSAVLEVALVEGGGGRITVGDFAFRPLLTGGAHHGIRPITAGATGEAARALRLAERILGKGAVRSFPDGSAGGGDR